MDQATPFDAKQLARGGAIGALACAAAMFCLWAFDVVPAEEMIRFTDTPLPGPVPGFTRALLVVGVFFAVIVACGWAKASYGRKRGVRVPIASPTLVPDLTSSRH